MVVMVVSVVVSVVVVMVVSVVVSVVMTASVAVVVVFSVTWAEVVTAPTTCTVPANRLHCRVLPSIAAKLADSGVTG